MPGSGAKIPIPTYYRNRLGYPKREYFYDYETAPVEYFSRKFLRTRGLANSPSKVNSMSVKRLNVLLDDAHSYFLYRDEVFHAKYDKCNNKDNQ